MVVVIIYCFIGYKGESSTRVLYIVSPCRADFVLFFYSMLSLELFRCPLIFFCPADDVPDWQPRILLGMVEAR